MKAFKDKSVFIYCAASFLLFTGYTQNESEFTFWQGEKQGASQRTVSGTLAIEDNVLLYEQFGMPHATGLEINGSKLSHNEIFIIDQQTLNHTGTISPPEGEGPRELTSFSSYDIYDGNVAITD